ncbi:hypothetical protein CALCODRAFT_489257 [Calocera cornea HHB12733]|uniref:Uncharacterized protein n=1 Tax=Calocera cornea HHB12733 TaxID=1353952 RepID=A0A165K783_9BASI|nr:hypothetical protein CALCODRAFT_489257 [Calocera cornea HHB12733]
MQAEPPECFCGPLVLLGALVLILHLLQHGSLLRTAATISGPWRARRGTALIPHIPSSSFPPPR